MKNRIRPRLVAGVAAAVATLLSFGAGAARGQATSPGPTTAGVGPSTAQAAPPPPPPPRAVTTTQAAPPAAVQLIAPHPFSAEDVGARWAVLSADVGTNPAGGGGGPMTVDPRVPAQTLLQANDAHRKAFTSMTQCQSCHGPQKAELGLQFLTEINDLQATLDDKARRVAQDGPRIGVTVGPLDEVLRAQLGLPAGRGIVVTDVLPETPAQRAGIEAHDVVVNVGGTPVDGEGDFDRLLLAAKPEGPPLGLRLIRRGQPLELTVAPLFPPPASKPAARLTVVDSADGTDASSAPRYRIGVQLAVADDTLRQQLNLGDTGVVVLEVLPNTPAERQGIRAYDVIVKAAGRPVRQDRDLMEAVQAAKDSKLELEIVRAGKPQALAVAPEVAPAPPLQMGIEYKKEPRELLMMPARGYDANSGHIVWRVNPAPATASGQPVSPDAAADQLNRVAREIDQLRASLDALRDRLEQEKKAAEKK